MTELTVIDPGPENIAGTIKLYLAASTSADVRVRRVISAPELAGRPPDILVLAPDAGYDSRNFTTPVRCGILILPAGADPENYDADCVVTYGMSPKSSITLSSIGEDECVLAIQRELPTVGGMLMERQEIKVGGGIAPESLLAVMGALLAAGCTLPEPIG